MKIKIKIDKKIILAENGQKIGEILNMDFPCGGHGKCGKCKVKIKSPRLPHSGRELQSLSTEEIKQGIHLACITPVQEGMEIETLSQDKSAKNKIISDGFMPEFEQKPAFDKFGVSVDIGTTTIAARLYDTNGNIMANQTMLNPQSTWGADVISRIEASIAQGGKKLAVSVQGAIDSLICEMCKTSHIESHDVQQVVITGNTVMLSLLTATSVEPLSKAPFLCERLFGETIFAKDIGLTSLCDKTSVYLPGCVAAFIGADVVSALLASDICNKGRTQLLVDIGTNGEMALWHKQKLYFCSTAAGPAFEGVGISMGMPGKSGAIDRVEIANNTLVAHTIDNATPCGICGSGIVDAVACLLRLGLVDETGYLQDDAVISAPVIITPNDIRAVQLSKSAICAGIYTLINAAGIDCEDIDNVYIAGGFGSYLNLANAGEIGLLPKELVSKTKSIGNAALSGASMMLLNPEFKTSVTRYINNADVLELSTDSFFMEKYIEEMCF